MTDASALPLTGPPHFAARVPTIQRPPTLVSPARARQSHVRSDPHPFGPHL